MEDLKVGALLVADARPVQRPASLLAVVTDRDRDQDAGRIAHWRIVPISEADANRLDVVSLLVRTDGAASGRCRRVGEGDHVADAAVHCLGQKVDVLGFQVGAGGFHVAYVEGDRVGAGLELAAY